MGMEELLQRQEIEDYESWRGEIAEEYNRYSEGVNARVKELEAANAELETKYQETAARNYELMVSATGQQEPEPENPEPVNPSKTIANLFKKE